VGRFVKIGIPWPQVMAPFVGVVEIVCGTLLLVGFLTRLATVPLLIDIAVALYSTKIATFAKNGFWGTLHEARTDVTMLLMPSSRQESLRKMPEKACSRNTRNRTSPRSRPASGP